MGKIRSRLRTWNPNKKDKMALENPNNLKDTMQVKTKEKLKGKSNQKRNIPKEKKPVKDVIDKKTKVMTKPKSDIKPKKKKEFDAIIVNNENIVNKEIEKASRVEDDDDEKPNEVKTKVKDTKASVIREDLIEKYLMLITLDSIKDCIKNKGCIVARSIARDVIGNEGWEKLTEAEKDIIIKRVDKIRKENMVNIFAV